MTLDIKQTEDQMQIPSEETPIEKPAANVLKRAYTAFLSALRGEDKALGKSSFKAIGNRLWVASYTNSFLDRDNDILTRKSHKGYVDRVQRGYVPMPELRFYHIPGTKHGKGLWVDLVEIDKESPVAVVTLGEFDDTPSGRAAENHYLKAGPKSYKMSHGFFSPEWAMQEKSGKRLIDAYNTFEITTLPADHNAASNLFTDFGIQEGLKMMTPEVKQDILERFGQEMIDQFEATKDAAKENVKKYQEFGIEFKDFVDSKEEATEEATEETPPVDSQLLSDVLGTINEVIEQQGTMMDQMTTLAQAFQAQQQVVNDKSAKVDEALKSINEFLNQTPTGVDESPALGSDTPDLKEAEDNMKARLKESDVDNFFGFPIENGSKA